MKKFFLLVPVAALAMTACTSESNEFVGDSQQQTREITFSPLSQKATRSAVLDASFPTEYDIYVAAFDAGSNKNFFAQTDFKHGYASGSDASGSYWGASGTAKYWPFTATTINFLAYSKYTTDISPTWGSPNYASGVTLAMADNSTNQDDLMYAVGQGTITQSGNALSIPEKVDMEFLHAQSLLTFKVKANVASTITLKKITLNNAYYSGTFAIDNSDYYNTTSAQAVKSAAWTSAGTQKATFDIFDGTYPVTTSSEKKAEVMVVPHPSLVSFDSFTLTYTMEGNDYTYTFEPADRNLLQAKNYVYDITFNLHEIFISATVDTWGTTSTNYIDIPGAAFKYVPSTGIAGTFTLPSATAGTYTCTITNLPADTYTVEIGSGTGTFLSNLKSSNLVLAAEGSINISFDVTADSGKNQTIILKNDTPETVYTLTIAQP